MYNFVLHISALFCLFCQLYKCIIFAIIISTREQ
nr:MAG TPA: hypothetical protein [Bacteriophage sp.]